MKKIKKGDNQKICLEKDKIRIYIIRRNLLTTKHKESGIMPQSLSSVYVHLVFSTKNRLPLITAELRSRLWSYIGGLCMNLNCFPIQIGGMDDHVHILCNFSREITIKDFVTEIKTKSSKWIKAQSRLTDDFYWQTGYGIFSVNPQECELAVEYIANQEEHHKKRSFQEEYLLFLKKYNISFDEKHLWDEK